ncbi:MAG: hypothetical protein ABI920_07255, partial [Casimicrobiaceae bacterium]
IGTTVDTTMPAAKDTTTDATMNAAASTTAAGNATVRATIRSLYIAAIVVLQVMLAWKLVPIIALGLQQHIRLGTLPDGWPSILQVTGAAACVVGTGLALGYPSVALMRHVQRGVQRFVGLPPWTIALTFMGLALLGMDAALRALARLPGSEAAEELLAAALALGPTGVALMSAGVLLGEILRRNRPMRARTFETPPASIEAAATTVAHPWRRAA